MAVPFANEQHRHFVYPEVVVLVSGENSLIDAPACSTGSSYRSKTAVFWAQQQSAALRLQRHSVVMGIRVCQKHRMWVWERSLGWRLHSVLERVERRRLTGAGGRWMDATGHSPAGERSNSIAVARGRARSLAPAVLERGPQHGWKVRWASWPEGGGSDSAWLSADVVPKEESSSSSTSLLGYPVRS